MQALLAALPIVAVLVLMLVVGWSAARAGTVAAIGTLLLAIFAFRFGGPTDPFGVPAGVLGVLAEAGFVSLTVIAIIGPALGIHHLQQRTGATATLRAGLARITPDPRVAALLIAWFFCLFLEGAAGFGTPVALAAPFLVAAGFRPVAAVVAAMVGHAAGVSFGAVGTPLLAQVTITDYSGGQLAWATAPYHLILGGLLAAVVVLVIGRAAEGRPPWLWGAAAAVLFFIPYGLIARFVGPELPTLGGALLGALGFVGLVVLLRRRAPATPVAVSVPVGVPPGPAGGGGDHADSDDADSADRAGEGPGAGAAGDDSSPPGMGVVRAAAPYLILVGLVLLSRLVPPVRDALYGVEVEWRLFDAFTGHVRPLYHPAVLLTVAFLLGALVQRAPLRQVRGAAATATGQLGWVLVALVAMVTIAFTMSQSGMTAQLAEAAAGAGPWWPLLAPAVGALGTFVTGSATASNVLFTEFQQSTAETAELPVLPLLGAQGFGAAVGNIICPHNIVAAAATVGLSGQEGRIMRVTLPVALGYVALGGLLAWWFVQ
ncbi:L-lactate permease [Natronosporangium hydrolyticum]|uniref:L-lactate permease n=1 Tax=Natronosporangium hydrolyticum TaxID=2811111 RepID=A0A895YCB5_9ACTN|nr:L-lactate permease [Natronosporangium hydrolyticum]QSB13083.1 L-lactate permease [Natronosporangium hydrolyticum]